MSQIFNRLEDQLEGTMLVANLRREIAKLKAENKALTQRVERLKAALEDTVKQMPEWTIRARAALSEEDANG